jgi:uncharacterized protein (DUF1697 family)
MPRYIALLRGINVGGNKKVPMAGLREMLTGLGYADVKTLLQSGNAVFTSPQRQPAVVERALEKAIQSTFGFPVTCVVRTAEEISQVVAHNPLATVATDPSRQMVLFLSGKLDPAKIEDIKPDDFVPETFALSEREIHVWYANGIIESRLAKVLTEKKIGLAATARNWNTVTKLANLVR